MSKRFLFTKSNEDIVRDIHEQAYRTQMNYRGCTQVVVKALMDHLDMYDQEVFRAVAPFAAGVASNGGSPCGALTGAILAIGLYCGRNDLLEAGPPKEVGKNLYVNFYTKCHDLAAEMFDRFDELWGTTICCDTGEVVGKNYGCQRSGG
jgi:C_GCAxxG_C_C family probable redox protein